jgi:hypothetical protein
VVVEHRARPRGRFRRLERQQMPALLDSIPDAQREMITLAFYGGLSHREIAAHLGTDEVAKLAGDGTKEPNESGPEGGQSAPTRSGMLTPTVASADG